MNKPILTERIIASEALRAEYVQDVINWLADHWSMDRALNENDAKPPDFGAIRPASDKPMTPHGSTNNHARRKHLSPPVGIPGIHVKNDSQPIIPLLHEAIEEVNQQFGFMVVSKGTVYSVNTHFDPNGRESVLEQLKRLLLAD